MKPPAFQFYADDFIAGVADMTQNEVGAYIMLLAHGWNTHGLKADDLDRLKILAKGDISKHVFGKFKLKNGKLFNKRQEKERKKQAEFRLKQKGNGAKGGRPKKKPTDNPSLLSGETQTEAKKSSPSPSPSPSPIHQDHKASSKAFTEQQTEMTARMHKCLNDEWENDRQKWMGRIKNETDKAERVIAEVESAIKEDRIKTTPAKYAEQIWKEFK